jgi:hypothetical protein
VPGCVPVDAVGRMLPALAVLPALDGVPEEPVHEAVAPSTAAAATASAATRPIRRPIQVCC